VNGPGAPKKSVKGSPFGFGVIPIALRAYVIDKKQLELLHLILLLSSGG
jgi:hypothetical protein